MLEHIVNRCSESASEDSEDQREALPSRSRSTYSDSFSHWQGDARLAEIVLLTGFRL